MPCSLVRAFRDAFCSRVSCSFSYRVSCIWKNATVLDVLAPMHCSLIMSLCRLLLQGQLYLKKATVLDVLAPTHCNLIMSL
jgi:hypothetical protein